MLLLHFLRTVAQGYARFLDAQSMTDVCHIVHLSYALLLRRIRYHCRIGEAQHLGIARDEGRRHVGEHFSLRQYARLLVYHGFQQVVGVYHTFHQDVGLAFSDKLYGKACRLVFVVGIYEVDVAHVGHQSLVGHHLRAASHEDCFHEAVLEGFGHCVLG